MTDTARKWFNSLLVSGCALALGVAGCSNPQPDAVRSADAGNRSDASDQSSTEQSEAADVRFGSVTSEQWQYENTDGWLLTTPNYEIFTTMGNPGFQEMLPAFMETAITHYTSALGDLPQPREPMRTYLFRARQDWETKTRELLPRQAETYLRLGRGGFATQGKAILYLIDRYGYSDTLAITAHEGWHQYSQTVFRHQLPIWLEEGVATYMEGVTTRRRSDEIVFRPWRNTERYYALRRAHRRDALIPMEQLLTRSPQSFLEDGRRELLTYYAQVWALTHFLHEAEGGKYADDLEQVLQDAAHGEMASRIARSTGREDQRTRNLAVASRNGHWLIPAYFTRDLDAFEREFLDFIADLCSDRNRWRVHRGISPFDD